LEFVNWIFENEIDHSQTTKIKYMKRVIGLGGIFVKYKDPEAVKAWYGKHLGLQMDQYGTNFEWRHSDAPEKKGFTQWSAFDAKTTYMEPSKADFMINYRVENLEELVRILKSEGVTVLDEIETFEYGKFVHILDNEGIKVELWEPIDEVYEKFVERSTK
jgi:predicted enzyme related to lactoylglutathione lyase